VKEFVLFVLISGVGWLLDLITFSFTTQAFDIPTSLANFLSSLLGVTYVWMIALRRVFNKPNFGFSRYLFIYWTYQLFSIFIYSILISIAVDTELVHTSDIILHTPSEITAKLLLTAPNLLTNFIFMKFLTIFMNTAAEKKSK
jgi:putative flippase GtrA